jgi:hypothetical protein
MLPSSTIENTEGFSVLLLNTALTDNVRRDLVTYIGTDWNTSTKTLNNIGFNTSNTNFTPNSSGYSAVNYTVPAAMPSITTGGTQGPTVALTLSRLVSTSSQSDWSIHVEDDYLFFSFKNGVTSKGEWIFIGKYTSLVTNTSITDDEPFIILTSQVRTNGGTIAGGIAYLKSLVPSLSAVQGGSAFSSRQSSSPGKASTYDKYSANPTEAYVSKVYLSRGTSPTDNLNTDLNIPVPNNASTFGFLRGELPDAFFAFDEDSLWGDSVQIGSDVYMYAGGLDYAHYGTNPQRTIALWIKIEV